MHPQIKGHTSLHSVQQFGSIKLHLDLFMLIHSDTNINPEKYEYSIIQWFNSSYIHSPKLTSWVSLTIGQFAREYPMWNATVTSLQCGTADHEPHILSSAIGVWVGTAILSSKPALTPEPARRNTIHSLHDHITWHFLKRTHTRRWWLWKWKWELKYLHSSQKRTTDIP